MKILCIVLLGLNMFVHVVPYPYDEMDDFSDFLDSIQSPIAISSRDVLMEDNMRPLEFQWHWRKDGNATILNTGKTAKVAFRGRNKQPYIIGGPLESDEPYIFEQLHFHWGKRDEHGSEHVINGQFYSMEAHLVYYNKKYGSYKRAANMKDGLAVVAFFIQASGDKDEFDFARITNHVQNVHEAKTKDYIDSDCLKWMESKELGRHYFSYHGSLTTPPYDECVTWIIYKTPVYVSRTQVEVFRHLRSLRNDRIISNNRPLQRPDKVPTIIFARNTKSNLLNKVSSFFGFRTKQG